MEDFISDLIYFLPFAGLIFFRILMARRGRKNKSGGVKPLQDQASPAAARTRPRGRLIKAGPVSVREAEIPPIAARIVHAMPPEQAGRYSEQAQVSLQPEPLRQPVPAAEKKNVAPASVFSRRIDILPPLKKALVTAEVLSRPRGW